MGTTTLHAESCNIGDMSERFGKSTGELQKWYLREWRKHRGMTQEQLAEAIDSTKQTVSRMESGTRTYNQPFLEACADALKCRPADLLNGPPEVQSSLSDLMELLSTKSDADLDKIRAMIELMGK